MLRIRTGSRLHFGLFNLGDTPRRFGGVGLMIDEPGLHISATPARHWSAEGPLSARVLEFARRFALSVSPSGGLPTPLLTPQHFSIERAAPEHTGLGTGTQLGMAIARLLAETCGWRARSAELAGRVGRGLRSALGVHGFERGGFLVEAGKRSPDELSPLVAHVPFPDEWRIVLVMPPHAAGLHGVPEKEAFARLAAEHAAPSHTELLCRLTLLGMLPALLERDLQAFGEALYEFNVRVGERFAPVQGGLYRDESVSKLVAFLRGESVAGVGQSSWGPAVFAVVGAAEQADALTARLRRQFPSIRDLFVTRAMNHGALVSRDERSGA